MYLLATLVCYQCFLLVGSSLGASLQQRVKTVMCSELSENLLSEILGPAFNSRYMSIDTPPVAELDLDIEGGSGGKRKANVLLPFYVEDDYAREIADEPAWSVNHIEALPTDDGDGGDVSGEGRSKRSPGKSGGAMRQWECESRITWIDLGPDYFPRYLRSVECTAKTCWYGHYKCKPRSFTVKILRRKRGRCTVAKAGGRVGVVGLPSELRQLWVWEERAVNFCCDCAL